MRKYSILCLVVAAATLVIGSVGCGGGGGAGGSNSGSLSAVYIEPRLLSASTVVVEPTQIAVNDQLQLHVYGTDTKSGSLIELTVTSWSTNAPASIATVDSTGVLTAVGSSSNTYRINAATQYGTFGADLKVNAQLARVVGKVRTSDTPQVKGVTVKAYKSDGSLVATTTSSSTGSFVLNLPVSATKFVVDLSAFSTSYYNSYGFGSRDYAASIAGCYTPLPALTLGNTVTFSNDVIVYPKTSSSPPPPPPSGCGL